MSRPWMPFYVGDYLRDTQHLTTREHGAYFLLLLHYWTHGQVPTDDENLRKICKISIHLWPKIRAALVPFFEMPHWRHKRVDKELEKQQILSLKRQIAAMKGGLKSRGRTNAGRLIKAAIAKQTGDQSQSHISKKEVTDEKGVVSWELAEAIRQREWNKL